MNTTSLTLHTCTFIIHLLAFVYTCIERRQLLCNIKKLLWTVHWRPLAKVIRHFADPERSGVGVILCVQGPNSSLTVYHPCIFSKNSRFSNALALWTGSELVYFFPNRELRWRGLSNNGDFIFFHQTPVQNGVPAKFVTQKFVALTNIVNSLVKHTSRLDGKIKYLWFLPDVAFVFCSMQSYVCTDIGWTTNIYKSCLIWFVDIIFSTWLL